MLGIYEQVSNTCKFFNFILSVQFWKASLWLM